MVKKPKASQPRRADRQWIVCLISGKRAGRLGTVAAADCDAAIAKAIDEFRITEPERQNASQSARLRTRVIERRGQFEAFDFITMASNEVQYVLEGLFCHYHWLNALLSVVTLFDQTENVAQIKLKQPAGASDE